MDYSSRFQLRSNGAVLTELPQIDATILHWLAEEAHGRQGVTLIVVKDEGGKLTLRSEQDLKTTDEPLFAVTTPKDAPQLQRPEEITLKVRGRDPERLDQIEGCDALFWSTSSIEKFLFPYYAAHRLLTDAEMSELKSKCRAKNVVAVLHVAPSKSFVRTGVDRFQVVQGAEEGASAGLISLRQFLT